MCRHRLLIAAAAITQETSSRPLLRLFPYAGLPLADGGACRVSSEARVLEILLPLYAVGGVPSGRGRILCSSPRLCCATTLWIRSLGFSRSLMEESWFSVSMM